MAVGAAADVLAEDSVGAAAAAAAADLFVLFVCDDEDAPSLVCSSNKSACWRLM